MDWIATIITGLTTGGIGVTLGTIYTARKNAQVGMSGNETEAAKAATADWTAFTTHMEIQLKRLDTKVNELEARLKDSEDYNDELLAHISAGLGPPAPKRQIQNRSE